MLLCAYQIIKNIFLKFINSSNLYKVIDNYYEYDSNQNYFDISHRLIKVNIISKKNFKIKKK